MPLPGRTAGVGPIESSTAEATAEQPTHHLAPSALGGQHLAPADPEEPPLHVASSALDEQRPARADAEESTPRITNPSTPGQQRPARADAEQHTPRSLSDALKLCDSMLALARLRDAQSSPPEAAGHRMVKAGQSTSSPFQTIEELTPVNRTVAQSTPDSSASKHRTNERSPPHGFQDRLKRPKFSSEDPEDIGPDFEAELEAENQEHTADSDDANLEPTLDRQEHMEDLDEILPELEAEHQEHMEDSDITNTELTPERQEHMEDLDHIESKSEAQHQERTETVTDALTPLALAQDQATSAAREYSHDLQQVEERLAQQNLAELNNLMAGIRADANKNLANLQSQIDECRTTNERLETELTATKTELTATKMELTATKMELTATKTELENELAAVKAELLATKTELTATKTELEKELATVEAEMATRMELTAAKTELEKELASTKADLATTRILLDVGLTAVKSEIADIVNNQGDITDDQGDIGDDLDDTDTEMLPSTEVVLPRVAPGYLRILDKQKAAPDTTFNSLTPATRRYSGASYYAASPGASSRSDGQRFCIRSRDAIAVENGNRTAMRELGTDRATALAGHHSTTTSGGLVNPQTTEEVLHTNRNLAGAAMNLVPKIGADMVISSLANHIVNPDQFIQLAKKDPSFRKEWDDAVQKWEESQQ